MHPLESMRYRSPVRRRVRRAKVERPGPDSIASRRCGEEGAVPPLGIGRQAVELAPYHAGLAGRDHPRRLIPPAFPTGSCPLRLAPSGESEGPEVSLRTSLDCVKDSVPRTAAHSFDAHGSPVPVLRQVKALGITPTRTPSLQGSLLPFALGLSAPCGRLSRPPTPTAAP